MKSNEPPLSVRDRLDKIRKILEITDVMSNNDEEYRNQCVLAIADIRKCVQ